MHNVAVNRLRCIWWLRKNEAGKNKEHGHYSFGKNKRYLLFYSRKLASCKQLLLSHGWIIRLSGQLYITGSHTMQIWCCFLTITHPSWLSMNSPKIRKCVLSNFYWKAQLFRKCAVRMFVSGNISKALGDVTKGTSTNVDVASSLLLVWWLQTEGCSGDLKRLFFCAKAFGIGNKDPEICRNCLTGNCVKPYMRFRRS